MPPTSGTTSPPLDAPLPRKTRAFIVLVALLQGGLLSLAALGQQHGVWPFTELGARICWYTLVMTIPGVALLSAQDLRDWRLWQHVAASTLVFTALGSWAAWTATGAPALNLNPVLWSFGFTVAVGWFVALPWLRHRQLRGHWRAGYRDLFEHAWQNALPLVLALLCVCVCRMVPGLWASLFALVKIQAFRDLFREQAFIYLATGLIPGLGILIGRTQHRAVQVLRQILFSLCTGLAAAVGRHCAALSAWAAVHLPAGVMSNPLGGFDPAEHGVRAGAVHQCRVPGWQCATAVSALAAAAVRSGLA